MYIYLDESYNLKDRDKKQFVSINGFMVSDVKKLFKYWKSFRKPFLKKKRRIHANDSYFNDLRKNAFMLVETYNLVLVSVFQVIQEISPDNFSLYNKGKLDFDRIYLLLLIELFRVMDLQEYRNVNIIIDNKKHKGGPLGKKEFESKIMEFLTKEYSETNFDFFMQASTTNILLELADFYSNILYRMYLDNDSSVFYDCRPRMYQIKNPLGDPRDVLK